MTEENQILLTVIVLSSIIILVNIISSTVIIIRSRKFLKSEIILRLYLPSYFTWLFILLSLCLVYALWHFSGVTENTVSLAAAIVSGIMHIFIMQCSAGGITKNALYTGGKITYWHNIYDYYIDKKRRTVIFSNNIKGGLTLKGLTKPLKYKKEDEEKLEKYLEQHKSKHFNKIIIR
ncbi:MAG: DUF5673 domain-containing protein [Clostridia bacterium]|nr:DUF5673 domain-containing protein [Clostridia bacterium]